MKVRQRTHAAASWRAIRTSAWPSSLPAISVAQVRTVISPITAEA